MRLLLLLLLALPVGVQAQFRYEILDETITITGYECAGGAVIIPSRIDDLPVTRIGGSAFSGCTSLMSVTIPSSVTIIGSSAFSGCSSLTAITVVADNSSYGSADGVLFDKSRTLLIQCPGGKTGNYTIPSSVTSIGGAAFSGCTRLTSVTIPSSVTYIGDYAFSGCSSLAGVYFLGSAPGVEPDPFYAATNVTVYYLEGTTGWGSMFSGRPTALWKPQVQTRDPSFGVPANPFGFTIVWASGRTVVVEACTDLAHPIWSPVATITLTDGSSFFTDPEWATYPSRFYRMRSP